MNTLTNYVEFTTDKEQKKYFDEVKKNNLSVIGQSSESPLDLGEYKGTITGKKNRIVGKTGDNEWCIFLMEVKVKGGSFSGVLDKIPFNQQLTTKSHQLLTLKYTKIKTD